MNNDKKFITLFSILGVLFSVGTFFALIEANVLYCLFGGLTEISFFVFPVLCLATIVVSSALLFKKSKISYVIPVSIALVGCILAFVFSNDASLNKIEADFLKHENAFNQVARESLELYGSGGTDGNTFGFDNDELKWVVPYRQVRVEEIDNAHNAVFLIAMETDNRLEGYAYTPYGSPLDWYENGVWSEAVDLDGYWYYLCLIK